MPGTARNADTTVVVATGQPWRRKITPNLLALDSGLPVGARGVPCAWRIAWSSRCTAVNAPAGQQASLKRAYYTLRILCGNTLFLP